NHLLLTAALGRGAHGSVYYALALPHQQVCAVKCIEYGHLTSARQRKLQRLEASLHAKCSSIPGVLNLYEVGDLPDLDAWYLVMDVAERGDLFDALDSGSIFSGCRDRRSREHLVQHLFLQVLETVRACHARGVYHRDLKPENFLLSSDPCQGGLPKLLLADFGLATDRTISSEYGCGSAFYMAPEAHPDATRPYKPAATDVWSLGILLINLVCQRNPWRRASPSDASYALHVEKYPHGLAELLPFTPTFSTVLARALDPNPETRATLSEFQETLMACP
ncbi:MAG: kinase-like domain-containing protein, partial [Piptocephalis tieghemiana]